MVLVETVRSTTQGSLEDATSLGHVYFIDPQPPQPSCAGMSAHVVKLEKGDNFGKVLDAVAENLQKMWVIPNGMVLRVHATIVAKGGKVPSPPELEKRFDEVAGDTQLLVWNRMLPSVAPLEGNKGVGVLQSVQHTWPEFAVVTPAYCDKFEQAPTAAAKPKKVGTPVVLFYEQGDPIGWVSQWLLVLVVVFLFMVLIIIFIVNTSASNAKKNRGGRTSRPLGGPTRTLWDEGEEND